MQTAFQIWFIKEIYFLFWQKLQTFLRNLLKYRLKVTCRFVTDFEDFFPCCLPPALSSPPNTELVHQTFWVFFPVWGLILMLCMLYSTNKKVNRETEFMAASHNKLCVGKIFHPAKAGCWALPRGFVLAWQNAQLLKGTVAHFHIFSVAFFAWEFSPLHESVISYFTSRTPALSCDVFSLCKWAVLAAGYPSHTSPLPIPGDPHTRVGC